MCVHVKVTHMAFFSALLIDRVEGIAVADSRSYVTLLFLVPLRCLDTWLRFLFQEAQHRHVECLSWEGP